MEKGSLDRRAFLSGRIASLASQVPVIGDRCFAMHGVVCRTCEDVCQEAAIRFGHRIGRPALPMLRADRCTSCGECVPACPADAIRLVPWEGEHDLG